MKSTVRVPFVCKATGKRYETTGADYEGDKGRIDELAKAGFVEALKAEVPASRKVKKQTDKE